MKSKADMMARLTAARKAAGLVQVKVWVPIENREEVIALEARLLKQANKSKEVALCQ